MAMGLSFLDENERPKDLSEYSEDAETIRDEAVREFAKMLVDKSENGVIQVSNLTEYVLEILSVKR